MENKILGILVASFITLIVGLALLSGLVDSNNKVQNTVSVGGKQFTLTNNTCSEISGTSCIVSVTSITNASSGLALGSGNYTLCSSGRASGNNGIYPLLVNTVPALNGAIVNASYVESTDCMYVNDTTSRTLSGLVILFFIIAIMVAAVYYLTKTGIMDWF